MTRQRRLRVSVPVQLAVFIFLLLNGLDPLGIIGPIDTIRVVHE